MGSHLYGSNHMSLGLSQVGSQISALQDQSHPSSNMLRLGSAGAAKFEHLIPPSNPSSLQAMAPSSAFFMADASQGFQDHQSTHHNPFPNKSLHGLMQLPDLQSNNNNSQNSANLFNLSFFANNSSTSSINNTENAGASNLSNSGFLSANQFNTGNSGGQGTGLFSSNMGDHVGSGLSSLYSNSMQQESISPHMSATALLQKAAQMGSTTSSNTSTLLRGLGSSSSGGAKSDRPLLSTNFGSFGSSSAGTETLRSQMENDNNLQGLMNSLANGSSSIFGAGGQGQESGFGGFSSSGITLDQQNSNPNFCNVNEAKLHQNIVASIGGSDKLTLDFLGVGGMVRNMGGGFSQREQQQHGINIRSLDPEVKSAQASEQQMGSAKLL